MLNDWITESDRAGDRMNGPARIRNQCLGFCEQFEVLDQRRYGQSVKLNHCNLRVAVPRYRSLDADIDTRRRKIASDLELGQIEYSKIAVVAVKTRGVINTSHSEIHPTVSPGAMV